jgi:hypothetical protein
MRLAPKKTVQLPLHMKQIPSLACSKLIVNTVPKNPLISHGPRVVSLKPLSPPPQPTYMLLANLSCSQSRKHQGLRKVHQNSYVPLHVNLHPRYRDLRLAELSSLHLVLRCAYCASELALIHSKGFMRVRHDSGVASNASGVETCSHLLRQSRKGRKGTENTNMGTIQ